MDTASMQSALQKVLKEEKSGEELFDDNIDDFDEMDALPFEADENGNYPRLLPHLIENVPPGKRAPNIYHRAELFHESVVQTMVDSWWRSKQICTNLLTGYPFVGIWVEMNEEPICGFSHKNKQNEVKGKIVECINSGRILALMTPSLIQKEILVLCPNAGTLASMLEFSILTNAPYRICFVSTQGYVWLTDIDISYLSIANLVVQNLYIQDVLISALEGYVAGDSEVDAPDEREDDEQEQDSESLAESVSDGSESGGFSDDSEYDEYDEYADLDEEEPEPDFDDPRLAAMSDVPDDLPDDFLD